MFSNRLRGTLLALVVLFTLFSLTTVFAAEPPKITVAPIWRPGTTLDSIDAGVLKIKDGADDFRYVDVDIYVTTTVQFWSVQLVCTATPAALTSYDDHTNDTLAPLPAKLGDGDGDNDVNPVIWGGAWGDKDTHYVEVIDPYNVTTGARTFTASRLGNNYPMGGANGTRDIFLLATLRYRAKDLAANAMATFTCTSTFLNRNGTPVLAATYTAPPPLPVITGYVASGTALYQGRASHAGITVECDGPNDFSVLTNAAGVWTNNVLRSQGHYDCSFYGDTTAPVTLGYKPDRYLAAKTSFDLNNLSYNVLPITLRGGNLEITGAATLDKDETVNMGDIGLITAPGAWNKTSPAGDVNGDGKTNQTDLTIAASNYDSQELVDGSHIIFSMPRDYDFWQHTRVWLGGLTSGTTTPLIPLPAGDVSDLWPMMSPDGKQIAFIRNRRVPTATLPEMGLYVAPVVNGVVGVPALITPANADYFALAPSWSPDGTRIAFVCSWYDNGDNNPPATYGVPSGYMADEGNLCLIDANGRNFRNMSQIFNVWERAKTRIYPPAWLSNSEILYGGAWHNPLCENTLCYADLQTNSFSQFDADIPFNSIAPVIISDMPVVRGNILFYRHYNQTGNVHTIRWATITSGPGVETFEARPGAGPDYHMVVDYDSDSGPGTAYIPVSSGADYYTVSASGQNILYYEAEDSTAIWRAPFNLYDVNGVAEWFQAGNPYVEDIVGNPYNLAHTPYNPDDINDFGDPTYAHRNTMQWLP